MELQFINYCVLTHCSLPNRLTSTESLKPCLRKQTMLTMFAKVPKTATPWHIPANSIQLRMEAVCALIKTSIPSSSRETLMNDRDESEGLIIVIFSKLLKCI